MMDKTLNCLLNKHLPPRLMPRGGGEKVYIIHIIRRHSYLIINKQLTRGENSTFKVGWNHKNLSHLHPFFGCFQPLIIPNMPVFGGVYPISIYGG